METGDVIALVAVLLAIIGLGLALAAWTSREVGSAREAASDGDRRLHKRIDEVEARTMSRADMLLHLDGLKEGVGEVKSDLRGLRDGMEALANAVIAGRGRDGPP